MSAQPAVSRRSARQPLLLAFLVVALLIAAIAVPVWLLHERYLRLGGEFVRKTVTYRRIAGTAPLIAEQIEMHKVRNPRKYFFRPGPPTRVAAEMQEATKKLIEDARAKVLSIQATPPRDEGKLRQIGLSVNFAGTIIAIETFLYQLENQEPFLFVDSLTIQGVNRGYRPTHESAPEFTGQIRLHGYAPIDPT